MLGGSDRKVVGAGEILLGAHVKIVVMRVVQHTFQALIGGDTDGPRRKAGMLVSIVR